MTVPAAPLVCFSHLPWDFVYQRPNHLMARAARGRPVYFIEEPARASTAGRMDIRRRDGVTVVRPTIPEGTSDVLADTMLRELLTDFFESERITAPWLWYYTPMALRWSAHLPSAAVVYDCMDELSAFRFAPAELRHLERQLLARADLVFTGGRSLYEAKRSVHPRTFCFPSSVDRAHFGQARKPLPDPVDQRDIAHPRIGYCGVVDERIDLTLIEEASRARPEWQIVMVGPVAKIDEADLPKSPNIHWLGMKPYSELPSYLAGWDVATMPFALNESTRFISPTKTPEYLTAGLPVVSTPVPDVVRPYGEERLVAIAATPAEFVEAIEAALATDREALVARVDEFLDSQSWDATWADMESLVLEAATDLEANTDVAPTATRTAVSPPAGRRATAARSAGQTVVAARPRPR